MANSVIFNSSNPRQCFISFPKQHSWGCFPAFTEALGCRTAHCDASWTEAGLPSFSPNWIIFRRARDENCVPARFMGKQKQQRLAVLAHQPMWSCFWKNWYRESLNPSSLFFKEAPRGSSKQSSTLWRSLILLRETSVSFGGSSINIHKAAETDNKQWLLLTKLLRNLALICNCIFHLHLIITCEKGRALRANCKKRYKNEEREELNSTELWVSRHPPYSQQNQEICIDLSQVTNTATWETPTCVLNSSEGLS